MPRITRLHFAGIGHRDARFPALKLDFRGADGLPSDSIIWAENGVGKSSLLTLFFSTYQTNRRQFLGARGVAKARELEDYVQERDLSFIITEWDITDDRGSASLLADEPRELLVVGQVLSWKGLDRSTGDLRRRFFTFRPNRDLAFEDLPVAGLAEPVKSYEAFHDWLNAQAKAHPKLQLVHETNQGDWRTHLESCHLDPELFAYQLRMNLDEGGVNEIFNELKENKDFIRLFLELGLDPGTPTQVRNNLSDFLPQHRRLEAMRAQVAFNDRLLVELKLFLDQLGLFRDAESKARIAGDAASLLLAQLQATAQQAAVELKQFEQKTKDLEESQRGVSSQRDSLRRRLNFFTHRRAQLEVSESQSALQAAEREVEFADKAARLVTLAERLALIADQEAAAGALGDAIRREQEQARPEREALEMLGAQLQKALNFELVQANARLTLAREQKINFRSQQAELQKQRETALQEKAGKGNALDGVEQFFTNRDRQRDKLRQEGVLESKEEAAAALERWQNAARISTDAATRARSERETALDEARQLSEHQAQLLSEAAKTDGRLNQLAARITDAEKRETGIATHSELQAAVEASRADLELTATLDRLRQRVVNLLNQLLRQNADMAEDERAEKYVDRDGLFPATRDVEAVVEHLKSQGIASATPATHWLALNADVATANALLASDPARFHGVMFNALADQTKAEAGAKSARSPHAPVQVSPTPEQMPKSAEPTALVVPPRHAGAYNREAAQAERVSLQSRLQTVRTGLDTLRGQHKSAAELETNLVAWLVEFGGGKLTTLREQRRGEEQSLTSLRQRAKEAGDQSAARQTLTQTLDNQAHQHEQAGHSASAKVAKLDAFVEQFETSLEARRQERETLKQRLAVLESELGTLQDTADQLKLSEPELDSEEQSARDQVRDFKNELTAITYVAAEQPESVTETLAALRQRYTAYVQRFDGRFKNTAAQGQLDEKRKQIITSKQSLDAEEFRDLHREEAQTLVAAGNLPVHRTNAKQRYTKAVSTRGAADLCLKQARKALEDRGIVGDLDKPLQGEIVPEKAADISNIVTSLQTEAARLETEHQRVRLDIEANDKAAQATTSRHERLKSQAKNLTNLDVQPSIQKESPALSADDAVIAASLDGLCASMLSTRKQVEQQRERLNERHVGIRDLTQSEDFSHELNIPARSLFTALTLPELLQGTVAVDRQRAVTEQTETLKAELQQMQQHRDLIVSELLTEAEKAVNLLGRAARFSKMPETMTGWEGEPFLRIHLSLPHNQDEKLMRLRAYVDDLLVRGNLPDGVRLVFDALLALVTERGMEATILKPETQRRMTRYPVREMSGWSEGERTTVAIILYCTLVKLRAQSRGLAERRAEVSALLLDNPVGKASKPEFLEMHRWIAGALGVQLIYATGINDPQALSVFPNRIRLAKNRIVPQTGELAVGVVGDEVESVIHNIRIFDGHGETDRAISPVTEA
jgi:hypothetical protein